LATGNRGPRYDPSVPAAVVPEFYKGVVGWADAARAQALGANGIASVVAVALIGTAVLGRLELQPSWVRALGLTAVILWIVTAGLFIYAVAVPASLAPAGEVQGTDAFVAAVLTQVKAERDEVRRRARWAVRTSAMAALLTVGSLAAIVFYPTEIVHGEVVVTGAEAKAAREVCPSASTDIRGQIEASSLNGDFVTIRPDAGVCGDPGEVLRIPRTTILAEDVQPTEDEWFPIP